MRSQFRANNFTTAVSRAQAAALLALPADLEALVAKEGRPDATDEQSHPEGDAALERAHMKLLFDEEVSPLFAQNLIGIASSEDYSLIYDFFFYSRQN